MLIKLIKKMPEMAGGVLPLLINKILLNPTCLQYTEALRIIISECATILMEKPNCLTSLLDNLSRLSYNIARRALLALLPLFKLSRVTRDSLIIVLRKLLFSPKVSCNSRRSWRTTPAWRTRASCASGGHRPRSSGPKNQAPPSLTPLFGSTAQRSPPMSAPYALI